MDATVTYSYDAASRLLGVTDSAGGSIANTYDRDGIVRWTAIEGQHGIGDLARFPGPAEILTAARGLKS